MPNLAIREFLYTNCIFKMSMRVAGVSLVRNVSKATDLEKRML